MNTDTALPAVSDADIYDRIVSAILDHHLPPGTKLVEDKLATAFGVSRTRIRPVLVRLFGLDAAPRCFVHVDRCEVLGHAGSPA
mgnify:CR=1 FL=1